MLFGSELTFQAAEYVDEEGLQHGEVIEPEDDEIGPLAMVIWEDPVSATIAGCCVL